MKKNKSEELSKKTAELAHYKNQVNALNKQIEEVKVWNKQ